VDENENKDENSFSLRVSFLNSEDFLIKNKNYSE
jgi:hypothetical protein